MKVPKQVARVVGWLAALAVIVTIASLSYDGSAEAGSTVGRSEGQVGKIVPVALGELKPDSAIIFMSSRWHDRGGRDIPGPFQIYAMNEWGGNVTQLTAGDPPGTYEHAAVSFDRRYIAANSWIAGRSLLWAYDLRQQTQARLVPYFYDAGAGGVDWAPDGFIYFAGREREPQSMADFGLQEIYKIRPDGSGLTRLTRTAQLAEVDVSVSEDGRLVAYVGNVLVYDRQTHYAKPQIWIMTADGSNQRVVFDGGPEPPNQRGEPVGGHDPEISSDNRQVVFSRVNSSFTNFEDIPGLNTAHDLFIVNLDGTQPRRFTPQGPIQVIPDWSNGKILYTEYNEEYDYIGLVLAHADGSRRIRLDCGLSKLWDGGRHGKWIPLVPGLFAPARGPDVRGDRNGTR